MSNTVFLELYNNYEKSRRSIYRSTFAIINWQNITLLQITVSPAVEIWGVILPHEFQCAAGGGRLKSAEIGNRIRPNCSTSDNLLIYVVQWNCNVMISATRSYLQPQDAFYLFLLMQ